MNEETVKPLTRWQRMKGLKMFGKEYDNQEILANLAEEDLKRLAQEESASSQEEESSSEESPEIDET